MAAGYDISIILKYLIFHQECTSRGDLLHQTTDGHFHYLDRMIITARMNESVRVLNHVCNMSVAFYALFLLLQSLAVIMFF